MKRYITSVIWGLVLLPAAGGETALPQPTEAEGNEILGIIRSNHLARTSLAYRSAVLQQMLAEANSFSDRLKLPPPHPIQSADIVGFYVGAPWFSKVEDMNLRSPVARVRAARIVAGGFIETTNFCFSFNQGHLWHVANRINHDERFSHYSEWAKTPSLINSNTAYQLATQWLASVDIDVGALEKQYEPKVEQRWFWNEPGLGVYHPPGDTNKTMLPIYEVTWGTNWLNFPANVQILGTTKELMKLGFGDFSVSRRPVLVISNAVELNNIPDPPTRHLQRHSPAATNPPSARTSPVHTDTTR